MNRVNSRIVVVIILLFAYDYRPNTKDNAWCEIEKVIFLRSYSTYSRLGDKIIRPVQIVIQIFPKVFIMEQVE